MLGNDVIDLALAKTESNWKRKGYLNKIFTISEQLLIQKSDNQDVTIWDLWSRKEAVYKIILQKGGKRGYYPIKIECLDLNLNGIVKFEDQFFYTKTFITEECIYSLAVENDSDFKNIKPLKDCDLIFKIDGIPFTKIDNKVLNISKTHHGRFEKIVYLKL